MEKKSENKQRIDPSQDPFQTLLRRVVNLTLTSQSMLVKKILEHNADNKEFIKTVYTMVRRIPVLEIEVAGEELLKQKIENWMESRLRNYTGPAKMSAVRLADECSAYYGKKWRKKKPKPQKEGEKEPTVRRLANDAKSKFRLPQRVVPMILKIARQVIDRVRKRREKSIRKDGA